MRRYFPRASVRARLLPVLLGLPIVLVGLNTFTVRADDELDQARARQEELQAAIVEQREALKELEAAGAKVKDALRRTSETLRGITADQNQARADIEEATAALRRVEVRYGHLVDRLRHLDWTLDILEDEERQSEADLADRQRLLAQRLAQAYQSQQVGLLQQLFSADSFTSALTQANSFLRFSSQDAELAAGIEKDQERLATLHRAISATRYRTDQLRLEVRKQAVIIRQQRARLEDAKARLDRLAAATKKIQQQQARNYASLDQSRAEAAQTLEKQKRAEQQLAADIERLIRERQQPEPSAGGPIPPATGGSFRWPMSGYVSQEFGCTGFPWEAPLGSCAHFHRGIDLVAPYGAAVGSAAAGRVVFAGYNPYDAPSDPAFIVIVDHGGGLVTWYAHLQPRVVVGAGGSVSAGQLIGYEGNTGRSTGPHLHWAVLRYGTWVNPRIFL